MAFDPALTKELRDLIVQNPDCPLLVFAGEEVNSGEYRWEAVTWMKVKKGEFLDYDHNYDEYTYTNREEFEDCIREHMANMEEEWYETPDEEYESEVQRRLHLFEPYWKPCIIVYFDN